MVNTIRPKKPLGQHFLTEPSYCKRIVHFAAVTSNDSVIEIGPGTGNLTQQLLKRANQVLGIEIDPEMVDFLQTKFAEDSRLKLIKADVLNQNWSEILERFLPAQYMVAGGKPCIPVKVIGNLPYNISTRIIKEMTGIEYRFQSYTFMTQKEVAERILAGPGSKDYGFLSLIVDFHFDRREGFDVPPGAFRPMPKVDSHVFQLTPRTSTFPDVNYELFLKIISSGFRHRRKTLWNNLTRTVSDKAVLLAAFDESGIPRKARAEDVNLEQYLCMTRVLCLPA
ncbi:MAG TPA: 16S rRNA (adenine(1518)-N(6)/adenine(1519)-N(6))-dimethyltransferase RsmA [Acidobacteriota bacterium]|nr:16S rRNA (adenine(1518)-N(6)/adenine(1519)-N(6))-dimethyltransferase RsmA [Acidobacteriota bacterium]